jgi:TatD DNase family protein
MDGLEEPLEEKVPMFDAHAHLNKENFGQELEDVVERAKRVGIVAIVAVTESPQEAESVLLLSKEEPMVKPSIGLHPELASRGELEETLQLIRQHRDELVSIGEVGLDYWIAKEEEERELQKRALKSQVELAQELGLPLNVHSRSAGRQTISLLKEMGAKRVFAPCFRWESLGCSFRSGGWLFLLYPTLGCEISPKNRNWSKPFPWKESSWSRTLRPLLQLLARETSQQTSSLHAKRWRG